MQFLADIVFFALEHPDEPFDRPFAEFGDAHAHGRETEVAGKRHVVETVTPAKPLDLTELLATA